jgi:Tol biopolymer transport system component
MKTELSRVYRELFRSVPVLLICQAVMNGSQPGADIGRLPHIDPDYVQIVIPPNIAPINFIINEPGTAYRVEISGESGPPIRIHSRKPKAILPMRQWKTFLKMNKGHDFNIRISSRDSTGKWVRYQPIWNTIASEEIDGYVVYRLINPAYVLWWNMGIYQRNIETFEEKAIITNRVTKNNCINCHAFRMNDPDKMLFHMRAAYGGTVFIQNGLISKVNTATDKTMSAGVYPSWHPDGRHVAFSVNKIYQSEYAMAGKSIHVYDKASDLVVYDLQTNMLTTCPQVSTQAMENSPAWSADGKMLYFIRGDSWNDDRPYTEYHYDLMRIPCDIQANQWGEAEMLVDASRIGKSVSFPRPSPDGRTLLFTMSDYGYFSIHIPSSDLYLLDLGTMQVSELASVNSSESDSYHSWSSNSRWFVFASKRKDGLCSRLYFSYVDTEGKAHKPVLLPQEDPAFYDTFIMNYNVPEMIRGPVKADHTDLIRAVREDPQQVQFDPSVDVDALSAATWIARESDKQREHIPSGEAERRRE